MKTRLNPAWVEWLMGMSVFMVVSDTRLENRSADVSEVMNNATRTNDV